ncbi:hypothetical protein [Microbacterium pseudoresistens]|uniref:MFS family permease n=1 Tax=Microbacterium pseudoresistens TaxID=640634 RepID=A0A7Y9JNW6_9MICO|nr:hypothetical protein [Microbacterium pseudoresistens]NYD54983.1 MFS family permease [Microbacterium pseudoresistens]
MSAPTWTPAPRPGLVPLHPLSFGTLLAKSFGALRHNPKILFGFAVVVQLLVLILTGVILGAVAIMSFMRLESMRPGSDEYMTVLIGSAATTIVAALVVGLGSTAFAAIVQGVVAADIAEAVLGDKPTLGQLWRRVRPAAWRLIAYSLLAALAVFLGISLALGIVFGGLAALTGFSEGGLVFAGIGTAFVGLGLIPLFVWLGTKLMLVPSVLVLERATLRDALVRSWRLIRGRFWVAFGVLILIGLIMGTAAQVVGVPASMVSSLIVPVVAPTGAPDASQILTIVLATVLPQVLVIVIQAISTVVQSTGATLVYLDCRMRHEGLDQDLLAAVERIHAGLPVERDPFLVDPTRAVTAEYRPLQKTVWDAPPPPPDPQGYGYTQGYPQQGYQGYQGYRTPGYQAYPPQATAPPASPAAPPPTAPRADDGRGWTAPGSDRG